jgi:site-specific recombinase XerD
MLSTEMTGLKIHFLRWLEQPDEGEAYSKNTIRSYSQAIDVFLSFLADNDINSLDDVSDTWIRAFVRKLSNDGLKQVSIKNKLSAVQLFWEVSLDFPMDRINPVSRYIESSKKKKRGGRTAKRLIPVLYAHEVDDLFDSVFESRQAISTRDMAIIGLMLDSGVRSDELCNITVKQLKDMMIMDRLVVIGKGDKERSIKVLTTHRSTIVSYMNTLQEKGLGEFAFLTIQDTKMSQRVLYQMVNHYLKRAGIEKPQMGGHLLRHTAASLMLREGMNIKQVQENLGHSSITTTEKYLHLV